MVIDDKNWFMRPASKGPGGTRFMLQAGCSADLWNARGQTSKMGHFSFSTSLSLTCISHKQLASWDEPCRTHCFYRQSGRQHVRLFKVATGIIVCLFTCLFASDDH